MKRCPTLTECPAVLYIPELEKTSPITAHNNIHTRNKTEGSYPVPVCIGDVLRHINVNKVTRNTIEIEIEISMPEAKEIGSPRQLNYSSLFDHKLKNSDEQGYICLKYVQM